MGSFFRVLVCGLLLCCLLNLQAAGRWVEVERGPFRVISDGNASAARIRLGQLEQFRYAFGMLTGTKEPQLVWQMEVLLSRDPLQPPALSRDAMVASVAETGPLPAAFLQSLAVQFVEDNLKRLPPDLETGLVALFSTIQSEGTRIRIGAPPDDPAKRTRGWGLLQMLVTDENSRGEVHVFLYNLQQGADLNTACRGAFQQPYAAIQDRLSHYLQAGSFGEASFSGAAINPARDFRADPLDSSEAGLALADLALAAGSPNAGALYKAIHGPEADAGAGLAALREGNKDEARKSFEVAISQGTKSARVYFEMGILETDGSKKPADFAKAMERNPRWAEPHYQMALALKNPANQIAALQKAVSLEPRKTEWWRRLAETATSAGEFQEAAKAWTGASLAARSEEERAQLANARENMEEQRSDAIEAERKRKEEQEAAELERVKQQTLREIHASENRANEALRANEAGTVSNPVPYSSLDAQGPKLEGSLVNLDCRAKFSILSLQDATGTVFHLVIGDRSQLSVPGSNVSIACGPQKSPRRIIVEYAPKADRKLGTIGEVRTVQFP